VRNSREPASQLRGIAFIAAAYFLYSLGDAAAKWLVHDLPVWQILFVRSAFATVYCAVACGRTAIASIFKAGNTFQLAAMSVANFLAWAAYYSAADKLQLPQLYAMYYVSPIIATLLAARMLHEPISRHHWLALAAGFIGVLIAVPPVGPLPKLIPALLGLSAAVLWAYSSVLYRENVPHNTNMQLMLLNNATMFGFSALPMPWLWHAPTVPQWEILLPIAVLGLAAHSLYLSGIRLVPVAVAGPIGFSSLLWSIALGYLVWGDVPSLHILLGGLLILLAAAIIFAADQRAGRVRP
jgi:drug/metabolite transporter (DMT)-like permease